MSNPVNKLPAEIWFTIVRDFGKQDILSISRVSKFFKEIAYPSLLTLYCSVHLHKDSRQLRLLLRSIILNPEAGNRVQTIQIEWGGGTNDVLTPATAPQIQIDRILFSNAAEATGVGNTLRTYLESGNQTDEARLILLLHLLPNLEELRLKPPAPKKGLLLDKILRGLSSVPPKALPAGLRSLRVLSRTAGNSTNFHAGLLVPYLQLPSLHTIDAQGLIAGNEDLGPPHPIASTVTTLILRYSFISAGTLKKLLCSLPVLKSFSYSPRKDLAPSDMYGLHGQQFGDALRSVSGTLEHLILDIPMAVPSFDEPEELGSLVDFKVLKSVTVQMGVLLGYLPLFQEALLEDLLPPSIEVFGMIYNEPWGMTDCVINMRSLVESKKKKLPQLKELDIGRFIGPGREIFEQLEMVCRRENVVLNMDRCQFQDEVSQWGSV